MAIWSLLLLRVQGIVETMQSMGQDASGNALLLDVGLWLSQKIKEHFKTNKTAINLKYIDPTYMIRAFIAMHLIMSICTLLAHSVVHGAMAGYTGFTIGQVSGRHCYIPFYRITKKQNKVSITDRTWARLLSTNQPSLLSKKDVHICIMVIHVGESVHDTCECVSFCSRV